MRRSLDSHPSEWRSSKWMVTFAVAFAVFTDGVVYDMVIPFLPELFTGRLKTPPEEVDSWTALSLESFGMALLLTNWVAGYIADGNFSKSRPFLVGIGIMLVATLIFFLSYDPYLIIAARALQGASEALVWVSGLAFLTSQVDPADLGICMGYTTLGSTMGELIGPLLGGYLYESLGHWAVFAVVEVVIGADIILRLLVKERNDDDDSLEEGTKPPSERDALLGGGQSTSSNERLAAPAQLESGRADDRPDAIGNTDYEDLELISALKAIGWNWVSSVVGGGVSGILRSELEATIPLYVLRHFGWNASASGSVMFALLFPMTLGPWVGKMTGIHGPRWFSAISSLGAGIFMVTLGFLTGDDSTTQALFVANVFAIGVCIAVGTTTQTTAIPAAAQKAEILRRRIRAGGQKLNWWLKLVTPGMMLSGLSTAWALGLFLGPAAADFFHFSTNDEWLHLSCFMAALSVVTGVYCSFTWKKW